MTHACRGCKCFEFALQDFGLPSEEVTVLVFDLVACFGAGWRGR